MKFAVPVGLVFLLSWLPVFAQNGLSAQPDDAANATTNEYNIGRIIGWAQATCSYHELSGLSTVFASTALKANINALEKTLIEIWAPLPAGGREKEMSRYVKKIVLKQYPSCIRIWPR